jgi:heat shock protein HslJ
MLLRILRFALPIACVSLVLATAGCRASETDRATSGTPIVPTVTTPSPPSPGDPTGVTWTLTGMLVDGIELPGSVPGGHAITLRFRPDLGQLIGNAGCNGYGAPYTLSGNALHLIGLGQTELGCAQPVVAEENAYLAALLRVGRFAIADGGDTLTLSSNDGRVQLTYRKS